VANRVSKETELKRLGELIETIVKYHFPRYLLLDDLIKTLGVTLEPRFANIELLAGMDYQRFIDRYCCEDVKMTINRIGHMNLFWTGPK